ncbi:MAG: carbon-nitrogen hydrolase family protein [Bacillota bacterium]
MKVKVAVVQTRLHEGERCNQVNMERAMSYLDQAVRQGAQLVCFPETFPGPWKEPLDFCPHLELAQAAKEKGVYLIYGTAERAEKAPDRHYIVEVLVGPNGETVGKYRRTSPPGPWIYRRSRLWDLNYLEADELPVFKTDLGVIGILVCSEVYVPELSRVLALKGAEIVFYPAGIYKAQLYDTWRLLIHARAIENLMYTATSQNILGTERGLAMIAGPEKVLAESDEEGVVCAVLDLDRIGEMREAQDAYVLPMPYATKPGLLKYWRRPQLYGDLVK